MKPWTPAIPASNQRPAGSGVSPPAAGGRHVSRRGLVVLVIAGSGGAALFTGCSRERTLGARRPPAVRVTDLPPYARRSQAALASYRYAVERPDLLAQLPCYCNCGDFAGHRNLRDCFVNAAGVFSDHGAYCQTCQDEALDARRLATAGHAVADIRRFIDETYQSRGKPTNTPPVA